MQSVEYLLINAQQAIKEKKYEEAEKCLSLILKIDSTNGAACYSLGLILIAKLQHHDACVYLEKAVSFCQDNADMFYRYGNTLYILAQYHKASIQFEKAFAIDKNHVSALNDYSACEYIQGHLKKAEQAARRVIAIDSSYVHPYINLANIFKDRGSIKEAISLYKTALSIDPSNYTANSNLLLCLCYSDQSPESIFYEHTLWEKRIFQQISPPSFPHKRLNRDKTPLRIGYISADFKTHSVAYFIEPILQYHDRSQFEIFCYSDVVNPDVVTMRLQSLRLNWRSIYGMDNRKVIDCIKKDTLDILVDLAGHAGNRRLGIFVNRCAPLQVTYLGYPNTTGVSNMDFRITDSFADPDEQNRYYTETLYRMPKNFLCYRPPEQSPASSETPAVKNGYITFGSFNNLPKINKKTIDLWSEILRRVPCSQLVMKTKPFNDDSVCAMYREYFKNNNIDPERIILLPYSRSRQEHLQCYNTIDIALDTFPYNGTTTTCEALWMGVPVITLAGKNHTGRVGVSLLTAVGLKGMIVPDLSNYTSLAMFFSRNLEKLSQLRKRLRLVVAHSSLCNAEEFTKDLEHGYKSMWRSMVDTKKSLYT